MAPLRRRPHWWDWEVELSPHIERRMIRRQFSEIDVRSMLQNAVQVRRNHVEGRFVVEARHRRRAWLIIVEPDAERECIVAITAYPVNR